MTSKATKKTESRMDPKFLPWATEWMGCHSPRWEILEEEQFKNIIERSFHFDCVEVLMQHINKYLEGSFSIKEEFM